MTAVCSVGCPEAEICFDVPVAREFGAQRLERFRPMTEGWTLSMATIIVFSIVRMDAAPLARFIFAALES